jgi:hypothetical protein
MTTPSRLLLQFIDRTIAYQLRDGGGNLLRRVDFPEIQRLVYRGEVEGVGSATRIKYLRQTPPQEVLPEEAPMLAAKERAASVNSQASKTTYREHIAERYYIIQHKHIDTRFAGERAA